MTVTDQIITYLAEYGPDTSFGIAEALDIPPATVFSALQRNRALFQSRDGTHERGKYCFLWSIRPDAPDLPPIGTTVTWSHRRPAHAQPIALSGMVVGCDWDGVHVRAHGETFAVSVKEIERG